MRLSHILLNVSAKQRTNRGKHAPSKVGLAPIMRDGIEYEFTLVFEVLVNHQAYASKDRTSMFINEGNFLITENTGRKIADWLASGKDVPPPPPTLPSAEPESTLPPQADRGTDRAYLAQLAKEGIIDIKEVSEVAKEYGVAKVTDLTAERFEMFMTNVRLYEAIVREAIKRNIPRAKLDEFAREHKADSLFLSKLETKQAIQTLILEQTTPKQEN